MKYDAEYLLDEPIEPERYELFEGPRYQFDCERRDFLKAVGGGILVCLIVGKAWGQRGGSRGGGTPQELAAWLHVGDDGQITVYSGKVEVGQNVRTMLTQAAAEELRAPVASIRMVLADTDIVPFDFGTSGSRSTPSMVPQIRKVATTARELMLDLAAEHLQAERGTLVVADGKVTHPPTNRSASFAELAKGRELTRSIGAAGTITPVSQWKVQGTSVPKVNGRDIVTGRHQYASDIQRPGMMHGKILRPDSLNATLASVDLTPAEAMQDVVVVRDGSFVGVAAPSVRQAERAVETIEATWQSAPGMAESELFAELKKPATAGGGGFRGGRGNYNRGSVDDGLAAADHKLAATYTVAYIAHAPLEPRAAVAEWSDGKLTVWTGTQQPFRVRGSLAEAFGIPAEQVRVIVPDTGSGYGGKHSGEAAIEAARLAKAAGKPVKLVWTREEEFTWAYFRPAGVIDVSAGVRSDGTITAWEFHNYNSGGSAIRPPYEIANQRIGSHSGNSPLRQGSYRALASTANIFARESHMDTLAHAIGMEPLAFRRANLKDERLLGVFEAAAAKFDWPNRQKSADVGFGIAGGTEKGSYVATCAEVAVDRATGKLRVVRLVTAFECGAVMNPDHLRNQVEGAVVMGLGGALFEAIHFGDDQITNPKFSRYRVPRFSDVPAMETVLVNRQDLASVGAGETPIVGVAPAIGNAIFDAVGVRLTSLPMVPKGLTL